ncbi:MAG: glycosyltransferase [Bacteroidota bacterium]
MRVLINGLPLFGNRLAGQLKAADPDSSFIFCDTYRSRLEQLRFLALLPFTDAVISMNGVTDRSGSLDAVLLFKKKLILQWQGTDALLAMERNQKGTLLRKYIDYALNLVDSDWLEEEIKSIGLQPERLTFKTAPEIQPVVGYERISAMTYIASHRQEFYGIKRVIELANAFPEIPFHVFGTAESQFSTPGNLFFHGWVDPATFTEQLRNTPIFLRLTEHEGFPVSVIEAMAAGCEVIMSMPYADARVSASNAQDKIRFQEALDSLHGRGLIPNQRAVETVYAQFEKTATLQKYLGRLTTFIKS